MATQIIIRRNRKQGEQAMPSVKESVEGSRFIDTKIPITWVLTSLGIIIAALLGTTWNFASQLSASSQKLDTVIKAFDEMRIAQTARDTKYDALRDLVFTTQRVVDVHELRLNALERIPPAAQHTR